MRDRLSTYWDAQLAFNDKFFQKKLGKNTNELTMEEKVTWTKNQLLSIVKEAMEVLDEVPNWKEHRNQPNELILSNLWEEIIDVNKFSVGLAQMWGMDSDQYYKEYMQKTNVVGQRWQQEQELNLIDKDKKICGIDIDGVLGNYHVWFTQFCKTKFHLPVDNYEDIKPMVTPEKYEEIKSEYRQSGWKASMPPMPGASELTHKLKDAGYQIIILTARPYQKYSRIYSDTLEFLKFNDIKFDAIIWDQQKHLKIIKEFPALEFMIEDTPEIIMDVAKAGYHVYMPTNPNNKNWTGFPKNVTRVESLEEMLKWFNDK